MALDTPYDDSNIVYQQKKIEGTLYKAVEKSGLMSVVSSQLYKRNWKLNHTERQMTIQDISSMPPILKATLPYDQIVSVAFNLFDVCEQVYENGDKLFKFTVKTNEREYNLLALSFADRMMWLHTFNWIILTNNFLKLSDDAKETLL